MFRSTVSGRQSRKSSAGSRRPAQRRPAVPERAKVMQSIKGETIDNPICAMPERIRQCTRLDGRYIGKKMMTLIETFYRLVMTKQTRINYTDRSLHLSQKRDRFCVVRCSLPGQFKSGGAAYQGRSSQAVQPIPGQFKSGGAAYRGMTSRAAQPARACQARLHSLSLPIYDLIFFFFFDGLNPFRSIQTMQDHGVQENGRGASGPRRDGRRRAKPFWPWRLPVHESAGSHPASQR